MKKILSIILILSSVVSITLADDAVNFQANAPKQVVLGKPFQLQYTINQHAKDLRAPELEDFDVLAGPFMSQSSSHSFVNGQRTSVYNIIFTYTLMAQREGSFSIPPASIVVSGNTYRSNGLKITVLPADEEPAQAQAQNQSQQSQRPAQSATNNVSSDNIFIKTLVSKTQVHEQEAILLSYKVYWAGVELAQFTNNTKLPEFKGFLKQDLEQDDIQTQLEHYNGRNYQTAVIYQTILYPQKAGDIKVDPAQFEAILRVQNRAQVRSIFDDFIGSYSNVARQFTAPGVTIHVDNLPTGKPAGFSGGVGHFDLTSKITETQITTNSPVTISIQVKGTGNMKLLKTPAIDWPEGFEVYDPKVTNNFKNTTSGVSGTKNIEYLAIARAAGDYTIPAITFSYYDTQENKYKTLTSPEYTIHVARGSNETEPTAVVNNYVGKEEIKQLGSDIRYITTSQFSVPKKGFMGDFGDPWWLYFLTIALVDLLFVFFCRKKISENADVSRVRYKKANKVAQKRLKTAKRLMADESNNSLFYEEIERAALIYLSDRLSIPTSSLNKENIAEMLRQKKVNDELIAEVTDLLSQAEYARYAPAIAPSMQTLYDQTATLIDKLEDTKI